MKDGVTAVTMCGWLFSSNVTREKVYKPFCGRYNVKSIKLPGVRNPNICGRAIPSNKDVFQTNCELLGNSKLKHMMCLCEEHQYLFHQLFIESYLAKDRKKLAFKPREMVQLLTENEGQVGGESDSNSAKETVLASSVKLRQNRHKTKRLVDEVEEHVNAQKGKKRIKVSNAKKVSVKNVRATKHVFQAKKRVRKQVLQAKKRVDKVIKPTSSLVVRVCAHHRIPTSNVCCHHDKKKGNCLIPICSLCVNAHKRGCRAVGNPNLLCKLTTFLCQHHFDAEVTNLHNNKGMSNLEYDKEVPFYNELEKITVTMNENVSEKQLSENSTTYAESDEWKQLAKYDLMRNEIVNYGTIFERLFASCDEYGAVQIPDVLPNVADGDTSRTSRRNKIFVRNFIGLFIWKNMNGDGSPMVKKNTFNPDKSPENVRDFRRHMTILEENYTFSHWANMMAMGVTDVNEAVLFNHCNNLKNTIKSGRIWNEESENTCGIFDKFVTILLEIDFPVENR